LIRNVVDDYLHSVTERDFYYLLQFLLESNGYDDIHFTHGNVEMGKDFICKKHGEQFVLVVKAKDVNQETFRREVRPQILQAITERGGHPNLNSTSYRVMFVTTGRINSPAQTSFTEFNRYLRTKLNEKPVKIWDFDTLVKKIYLEHLENDILRNKSALELSRLYALIARIQRDEDLDWFEIEEYSRLWVIANADHQHLSVPIVESSLLLRLLMDHKKRYGALVLLVGLLRAICSTSGFFAYRHLVLDAIREHLDTLSDEEVTFAKEIGLHKGFVGDEFIFFAYPRRCLSAIEVTAVSYLLFGEDSRLSALCELLACEPGCSKPLSENYMVTVWLTGLALHKGRRVELLKKYLVNLTVWLCDRYDQVGLARLGATRQQEVEQLLSEYLSGFDFAKNVSSPMASVILFLASYLQDRDLYADVANDLRAVDIILEYHHVLEVQGLYSLDWKVSSQSFDPDFTLELTEGYSRPLVFELEQSKRPDDVQYALLSLILFRDRFYPSLIERFLTLDH